MVWTRIHFASKNRYPPGFLHESSKPEFFYDFWPILADALEIVVDTDAGNLYSYFIDPYRACLAGLPMASHVAI